MGKGKEKILFSFYFLMDVGLHNTVFTYQGYIKDTLGQAEIYQGPCSNKTFLGSSFQNSQK